MDRMGQHKFNKTARLPKDGQLQREPIRKIETWEELDGLVSADGKYTIVVDNNRCAGWIRPVHETTDTEQNFFTHHEYLSTHTFYEKTHQYSTEVLQRFGFSVELVSWG